jgi:FKBP-type peptidyl-prolyl cis-trans isomerase FklB
MTMRSGWLVLVAAAACGTSEGSDTAPLREAHARSSYALGFEVGLDLKKRDVALDPALACNGLRDALRGDTARVDERERKKLVTQLKTESLGRQARGQREIASQNAEAGKRFRAEHEKQPGVVTLPSGLQYRIAKAGMGPMPTLADTAIAHYRVTTIDGSEIEDTRAGGRPAELVVKRMVRGVAEALQRMPTGSSWQVVVPPELAYGTRGAPRSRIGPNQTLVFTIDLLAIKPPAPPEAADVAE